MFHAGIQKRDSSKLDIKNAFENLFAAFIRYLPFHKIIKDKSIVKILKPAIEGCIWNVININRNSYSYFK